MSRERLDSGELERKILTFEEASEKIAELKEKGLKVVLVQGVFDVVHIGHIEHLLISKNKGDVLFVGLEGDESVRLNKGENRPLNTLGDRLKFLATIQVVDFVFGFEESAVYSKDVDTYIGRYRRLSPSMIVVSSWDPNIELKRMQAKQAGIELVGIDYQDKRSSTTRILKALGYD